MAVSPRKLNRTYRRGELGTQLQLIVDAIQDIKVKYTSMKVVVDELKTDLGTHVTTYNSMVTGPLTELKADINTIKDNNNTLRSGAITQIAQMYTAKRGSPHLVADAASNFTTAIGTDEATMVTFANAFKAKVNSHYHLEGDVHTRASAFYALAKGAPHASADAANVNDDPIATSNDTCHTLLTNMKADFNAHILTIPRHYAADATNTSTAAAATDEASSAALANDLKAMLNAHMALAGATGHYKPDGAQAAITTADAVLYASSWNLANEIKALHNLHCASTFNPVLEADLITSATATDLAGVYLILNEIQTDLNLHLADVTCHVQADTKNAPDATTVATTLETSIALGSALKTLFNAHIVSAETCSGATHTALTASNYAAEATTIGYTPTQETIAIAASTAALTYTDPDDLAD